MVNYDVNVQMEEADPNQDPSPKIAKVDMPSSLILRN